MRNLTSKINLGATQETGPVRRNASEAGAALLTVLIALMIISLMTLELKYSAMLERKLAYNDLNQVQAYYLAKAGVRMGLLRVAMYGRAKRDPAVKSLGANLPLDRYLDMIWSLPLPPFPPPKDKNQLSKLGKADKDAAEKILEETKISQGRFSHVISSESSKVNLNFLDLHYLPQNLQNQPVKFRDETNPNLVQFTGLSLINIMEDLIKQSDNPNDEFGNLKPEEVVMNILEWVNSANMNPNKNTASASFYEQQKPPYKIKRGHFFTVDELKLVAGIDSHLFELLRPHITVYSDDGKINLNNASNKILRAIYPDFSEDDLKKIGEEKAKRGSWTTEKEFVDYVTRDLNRNGFSRLYPDEKNYPFTVGTRSFVIESLGVIQRGSTEIQKLIKVAVSLQAGKGASVDPTIVDQPTCDSKPGKFWYRVEGRCRNKPTTESQCVKILAGSWRPGQSRPNQSCCVINNQGEICPDQKTTSAPEEPSQMKVMSWSET